MGLFGLIMFFELARRTVNMCKMEDYTLNSVLYTLLPRPWCAISCWTLMLAILVNKKTFYNIASYTSLLCALIFFAYPSAGFNNKYVLFENLYSIATHSLILITSILMITLKFTKFEVKSIWKELIYFAGIIIYTFMEIYILKIATDPMYFMPNNDVQKILSISFSAYLIGYILFMTIYVSAFYLIGDRKFIFKKNK